MENWKVDSFSHNGFCCDDERKALEARYWPITEVTDKFSRQSVSYQLSKNDRLHRWLKYKEAFSADLVKTLLDEFGIKAGDTVLDPFAGSGTTAITCSMLGINSYGYDILPMTNVSIGAKSRAFDYDIDELKRMLSELRTLQTPADYDKATPYVVITMDGYPEQTAKDIAYYTEHFKHSDYSCDAKLLMTLCIINSLEAVSYSVKSGQYLGWDYRCPKIIEAARQREAQGRKPIVTKVDKGELPTLADVLTAELSDVIEDIISLQAMKPEQRGTTRFYEGSVLSEILNLQDGKIDCVITSPPYLNRYDYTRTYALELAYMGKNDEDILRLRQELLSCTVESRTKVDRLREVYECHGRLSDYERIRSIVESNKALCEINQALVARFNNGEVNNKGVLRMVSGYFMELGFLFAELHRVCKSGAYVAVVNDNVRYAGEVIPVDYLMTDIAQSIGFEPVKVYTLRQQKGNSSQQMAKYGRVALRKSITIWKSVQSVQSVVKKN